MNEEINYNVEKVSTKNGSMTLLYIDPKTSENVYQFKDKIASFDANWNQAKKRWQWILPIDAEERKTYVEKYVIPCIKFLRSVEDEGKSVRSDNEVTGKVQELISQIDKVINGTFETNEEFGTDNVKDVKQQLLQFKKDLLNCTTDEEFRKRFAPILKKVTQGGYTYSLLNTILIYVQDPEATMVYSLTKWQRNNRYVFDKKHPIALWVPVNYNGNSKYITEKFLKKVGKDDVSELTPEELDELDNLLGFDHGMFFKLVPSFYDIRFTKVQKFKKDKIQFGKERLVNTKTGNENGDLQWFDENTPVTEDSIKLYDATIATIQDMGIKISYVDNLGGARGVSKGGLIEILKDAPKNIGTCNTIIHELSHELFHQTYLKKNDNKYEKYFTNAKERNIKEQQAELSAWCLMRLFGYDMKTNINYLGNWGINEENALQVFDQIANAVNLLYSKLNENLSKMLNENEGTTMLNGQDIANMVGGIFKKIYDKAKAEHLESVNEQMKKITNDFKKICNIDIKK